MDSSGNGDGWPDGGLPELPPDWGPIVVPDDPAELAAEAALVRRELRQRARAAAWRDPLGIAARSGGQLSLRLPLLLLALAVLATVTSLFAVIRVNPARQQGGARATAPVVPAGTSGPASDRQLPALDLAAENGELVSLRSLLPAVIILVDGCTCAGQVMDAARAVPAQVTVVALTNRAAPPAIPPARPTTTPAPAPVRTLVDPTGELRAFLQAAPPKGGAGTVVLADRFAKIIRVVPELRSVEDYRSDLPRLVDR